MGTRAAAFTAKIRSLQEFHNRIVNNVFPVPSGTDICNTLKYFSQLLLGILREVPPIPIELIRSHDRDHSRTSMFPSVDYKSLYIVIVQFLEVLPQIQTGMQIVGQTILHTMSCLVPFLEHEYMDSLPYTVTSAMAVLPPLLHKELLDMLCYNLLPFTIDENSDSENLNYANTAIPSIIMIILNYADNPSFHTQLLECLMRLKYNVAKDLLCVIAYGTAKARCAAVELLFLYWPHLNPSALDRKALSEKHVSWTPLTCQYENCQNNLSNEAVKMCIDHTIVIGTSSERPTPLLICIECTDQIYRGKSRDTLLNILLPMEEISYNCENKTCKTSLSQKTAVATCFSIECTNYNCNKPIRYCQTCNDEKHCNKESINHIVHTIIPSPWDMDSETQNYLVEAIVSLLKEAQPDKPSKDGERHSRIGFQVPDDGQESTIEERQLLSRYGVWLLVGLGAPNESTPETALGRMLSMLCQWFHYTACLPDDQAGSALERLKGECIHGWLMKIIKTHFNVFTACLLPHPLDYARLGGHWESWPSQTNQIKEGFKRLLCLVPYDIITADVWGHIMPYWMECFRHDVPEEELSELKILLSKVLDPDLSPLGLQPKQMYHFISIRFENTTAPIQEQALCWLQILTMLEVPVPLKLLITMFSTGVQSLSDPNVENICTVSKIYPDPGSTCLTKSNTRAHIIEPPVNDQEINLSVYILMLDILVKQFELQEVNSHKGLETKEAIQILKLILDVLHAPWIGTHTCRDLNQVDINEGEIQECLYCEMCAIWYQLTLLIIEYYCPVMEVTMADIPGDNNTVKANIPKHEKVSKSDSVGSTKEMPKPLQLMSNNSVSNLELKTSSTDPNDPSLKSATILDIEENFGPVVPIESVETGVARSVTITEDDVATNKCTVSTVPQLLDEDNDSVFDKKFDDSNKNFWETSYGKFKFTIEELSPQEQLVYVFLKEVNVHNDADVLYHMLYCIKLMSLHSEVLNRAAKNHRGFVIWCQENLLIPNLWKLLQSEYSQISQLCVPLILHCITLPAGTVMFSKVVEEDFHNNDWRARFAAVERVTTIAHFVEPATVKNSPLLQGSLASAFCYLVHCLDDIEASVAQRTILNLEMIKTSSLKLLLWCLEVQFDLVILDRPMILTTIFQLYNHLSDRRFLSWDFFLNRFDALFLESQILLERTGEMSQNRDLRNTNVNSETYQKKVIRAHEALSHTHASRSLSSSFGSKLQYKRTMSAPTFALIPKFEKDKLFGRQTSAPALSRKSSKLAALTGSAITHLPNSFFQDSQLKDDTQEETYLLNVVHKVTEVEDHDKDTMHLLIFLLMQFLSRPDPSHPIDADSKTRSQSIVLRHLDILMGYCPSEKSFHISSNTLRGLPVFNAFITSMPKVLDFNFKMGNVLLSTCLPLLVFCPAPDRYIHDCNHLPVYSLWLLKPHVRQSWLMSVQIILYKHSYGSQSYPKQIQMLITIVMNTLEAQFHRCHPLNEHMQSPIPSRSRDLSTVSVDLEHIPEHEQSIDSQTDDNEMPKLNENTSAFSSDADDEDKEVEEIIESPKSKVEKTDEKKDLINIEKESQIIEFSKQNSINEDKRLIKADLITSESVVNKSELILSNNLENEENMTQKVEEVIVNAPKVPFHPPVQRVSKPLSPKLNRPKMQRMEAIEGSIKLKKNRKESKDLSEKQIKPKDMEISIPSHNSLTRIASADERHSTHESGHKVLRNVNSTDSTQIKASKSTSTTNWTIEIHSPVKLQPILPVKPPPERLLPIGMSAKEMRNSKESSLKDDFSQHYDRLYSGEYDKGVQTFKSFVPNESEMHYPVCERLLPIGPNPPFTRKDTISASPQTHQKRSSNIQTNILMKDENKSETSVPTTQVMSTICTTSATTYTKTITSTQITQTNIKSPLSPRESIDSPDVKVKSPNSPIMIGMAKVVRASEAPELPSNDWLKKENNCKTNENVSKLQSKPEISESKEETIEKVVIEMQSTVGQNTGSDKPEESQTQPSVVLSNQTTNEEPKPVRHYRQRKARKIGSNVSEIQRSIESRGGGVADKVSRRTGRSIPIKRTTSSQSTTNANQSPEDIIHERCTRCGNVLEQFSEEEIGLCIIILGAYIHRDPCAAAAILPDVLKLVSKFAGLTAFHWQNESNIHLPGSTASIARQFIRCTLHQLAPNGIFKQLFYAHFANPQFFKSIALALSDFVDLNQVSPLVELFQNLNERKHLPNISEMMHMLGNVATYLECISLETPSQQPWALFLPQLETFLRKLLLLLPDAGVLNLTPLMRIMLSTIKLPIINTYKTILDPFSKVLSHVVQQSPLLYEQLLELCNLCCRNFIRERDRYLLTRTVVCELIQAIKFRTLIPDENLMMLVQFILQDASGTLTPSVIVENLRMNNTLEIENFNTNASECIRQNVMDLLEFVTDVHTLSRVKSNFLGTSIHLNEETLGGHLKAAISQYLSLEMTKNNGSDHRAITKYLPWLYSLPSLQQGPKEFIDCVAHIRSLSWLLLGSLQHSALLHNNATFLCQPIPLEANTHIAEHIQVILAGFAEQSKASVLHMSSLFHAFILCQLWTMYCENISGQNPPGSDQYHQCTLTLSDFWAKITPGILQLICHSKVLAETVSLHFLNLMETLMECNSTMLSRLMPLWTPVFNSYKGQLSGNTQVRLQSVINWRTPPQTRDDAAMTSSTLIRWLQRMQTKMSQIEMQSSAAIQFYCI